MLALSSHMIDIAAIAAEHDFRKRLELYLSERHPGFLPVFPAEKRQWILANLLERTRAFGATWESNIAKLCDMMISVAPNMLSQRQVYARVYPAFKPQKVERRFAIDRRIRVLESSMSDTDWAMLRQNRSDLALYTPLTLDSADYRSRVAYALQVVYWDKVTSETAEFWADTGITTAELEGLSSVDHAPVVVAGWKLLAPQMSSAEWRATDGDSDLIRLKRALQAIAGQVV